MTAVVPPITSKFKAGRRRVYILMSSTGCRGGFKSIKLGPSHLKQSLGSVQEEGENNGFEQQPGCLPQPPLHLVSFLFSVPSTVFLL